MDMLGRYYTNEMVSSLLVNSMETKSAERILDLGIGNGSLTKAAYGRWKKAIFYATEIENRKVKEIEKRLSFVKIANYDSLKSNVKTRLEIKLGSIDVAICNPPYVKVEKKRSYKKLFREAGIEECLGLKKLSSEIVFFAHNLALLKPNGELGIIVSDSLITGKDFRLFRETILRKCDVRTVIQLPDKIFPNTEARTHILLLGKTSSKSERSNLLLVNSTGKFDDNLVVEKTKLIDRMDFQFWKYDIGNQSDQLKLSDIGAKIMRGHFSYKELREGKFSFFHTTHFKEKTRGLRFPKKISKKNLGYAAKKGDIILCRVGKRAIGKMARITEGNVIISDCIFSITVPVKYRDQVWRRLNSQAGRQWLNAYAHGVCSQVISKSDLEKFPIM